MKSILVQPSSTFSIVDIRDRAELSLPGYVAPSAICCAVVRPIVLTETWHSMHMSGEWFENAGLLNCYGGDFGDACAWIGLEGKWWTIEVNYPDSERPPAVLGRGVALVVTQSPMEAAQLAKACVLGSEPVTPFEWLSYS